MAAKTLFEGAATSVLWTDRRKFYLKPQSYAALWRDPAPFMFMLEQLPGMTHDDPLFKLFEEESPWVDQYFRVNGSAVTITASSSPESDAITVDGITGWNSTVDESFEGLECEVWDSTLTTNKGVVVITDAASSTTIKCKNLTGTDITTADDDYFFIVSTVRGEGTTAGEAWADELKTVWNSTQFFELPVEITGRLYRASLRGASSELARLRDQKIKNMQILKENAFLKGYSKVGTNLDHAGTDSFSEASLATETASGNSRKLRTTYGLIPAINNYGVSSTTSDYQNIFSVAEASYNINDMYDDSEKWFQFEDSNVRLAFSGWQAITFWAKKAHDKYFSNEGIKFYPNETNKIGLRVSILVTPHGELQLVKTKALRGPYSKHMVIPSLMDLQKVTYEESRYKTNIKTDDDYDGVKDVITEDSGLGINLIKKHHLVKIV